MLVFPCTNTFPSQTDTYSAVLGLPIPEDSTELGKLKLEHIVKKGIFLAPKSYTLFIEDAGHIMKQKGAANFHESLIIQKLRSRAVLR